MRGGLLWSGAEGGDSGCFCGCGGMALRGLCGGDVVGGFVVLVLPIEVLGVHWDLADSQSSRVVVALTLVLDIAPRAFRWMWLVVMVVGRDVDLSFRWRTLVAVVWVGSRLFLGEGERVVCV